jgi:Ca2+-binding RTX toxin-like protein
MLVPQYIISSLFIVSKMMFFLSFIDYHFDLFQYPISTFFSIIAKMSKGLLMLTIIGTAIITATLSTTTISLIGGILSLPLSSSLVVNVWALNVTGTPEPDTLTGTAERDTIRGYEGDDIISGIDGNDQIRGDAGADTIHGDAGRDRIRSDNGKDVIFGDDGNDILIGGRSNDTLTGGPGKDTFNCGEGIDTVTDFDLVINDTVMASCENISSSSSSPSSASTIDNITKNPFNLPLDQGNGGQRPMMATQELQ